jgi:chemotaxis response regulator CheB
MDARRESDHSRILIVDDNQDSLEILRARLESWGYRTQTASDGEEALAKIDVSPPDLILLDIMMPRMDGMEVARRVKETRLCRSFRSSWRRRSPRPSPRSKDRLGRGRLHHQAIDFAEPKPASIRCSIKRLQAEPRTASVSCSTSTSSCST